MHPVPAALAHREVLGGPGWCGGGAASPCPDDSLPGVSGMLGPAREDSYLLIPMNHTLYCSCKLFKDSGVSLYFPNTSLCNDPDNLDYLLPQVF